MIFGVFRHVSGFEVTIARPWSKNNVHPVVTIGAHFIQVAASRLGGVNMNEWTHVSTAHCDCGLDQEETAP